MTKWFYSLFLLILPLLLHGQVIPRFEYLIQAQGVSEIPPSLKLVKCVYQREEEDINGMLSFRFKTDTTIHYLEIEELIKLSFKPGDAGVGLVKPKKQTVPAAKETDTIVSFANIEEGKWKFFTVTAKDAYNNILLKFNIKLYTPDTSQIFTLEQWKNSYPPEQTSVEFKNIRN